MRQIQNGSIEALLPRCLVKSADNLLASKVSAEGLLPVKISWNEGQINGIEVINFSPKASLKLVLPRLIEPHAHIDKAFTCSDGPNLKGTYADALAANLRELNTRTALEVRERAERSLELALKNGVRALRSHVDALGPEMYQTWEVLIDIQRDWKELIDLQLVLLAPVEYWNTLEGKSFATKIAKQGGLLGSVISPTFHKEESCFALIQMLKIADQLECGVDLHIDESSKCPAYGIKKLLKILDETKINIPITCSHLSSLAMIRPTALSDLAERLEYHSINVVALPFTNGWLLGKKYMHTPLERPFAPISQLQKAGVTVAIGGDNVQDFWFPGGSFDPLAVMAFALPFAQISPWQRLGLAPFTTSAAFLMGLDWDGTFEIGCPADLILLDSVNWVDTLVKIPDRRVLIKGEWLEEKFLGISKQNN